MGDKRYDGYIFVNYGSKILKKGPFKGFFKEGFYSPKKFKQFKIKQKTKEPFKRNPKRNKSFNWEAMEIWRG